jgi:GT2 family glycosyltransferase
MIFILCFNQASFTEACLDSVLAHTELDSNIRVVVFDNGSSDNTQRVLEHYHGQIGVQRVPNNLGVFKAMNIGFKDAINCNSTFTIVANDHIVTPGWFDLLREAAEQTPGIYSPSVADYPITPLLKSLADRRNSLRAQYFRSSQASKQKIVSFMNALYPDGLDAAAEIVAQEGLQIIHPDVIRTIGYMDERFGFHFGGDMDYIYRAKAAGFPVRNIYSYVHHFGSITLRKAIGDFEQQTYRKDIGSGGTADFFEYKKRLIKRDKINEYVLDGVQYRKQL